MAKKKQGFSLFFAKLLGKYKIKVPKDTGIANKKKSDTTKPALKIPHPALLKFTQGGITWTSLYTQGVNLNTGVTGMYNLAHVFQDFNVAGIPLVGEATGVTEDGRFMKDYSSYSINFDSRTFLSALEKRAKDGEMNKLAEDRSHLPAGQHMNLSDSMKAFEDTRAKLTSPAYQADIDVCKKRLQKIEDSISKSEEKTAIKDAKKDTSKIEKGIKDSVKKDSKTNPGMKDSLAGKSSKQDTLNKPTKQDSIAKATKTEKDSVQNNIKRDTTELHNLRQKIATYEKLEKRYEQLFAIKKNYAKLTQADSTSKNEEAKYEKEKGSLSNPDNAVKSLEQNKMLKPYEKFLSGFQYITIGRANPEISEFTLHNFMMNGIDIGYKTGDVYVSGGYGKEQAVIDPYLMTGINVPTYNRTVEFGSIGIGSPKESNLYATVINISNPASTSVLSESNWIFDLSKKIVLAKNFDVTGEIAHSYFTYLPNKLDSAILPTVNPNSSDLAYAIKAHGIIPILKTDIQADYLNTGNNYITLGNQFLLSGTKTYRIELKQKVSRKLTLELGGAHVVQNPNGLTGTQGTDNWIDAGVKYKPVSAVDLEFNYSPRQFQQQQGTVVANNITSNINQISFTSNVRAEVLGRSTLSTIFLGNFQYSTPDNSTFLAQNINLTYYMLNETIMLTNVSSVNFTGNESRSAWTGDMSQFIGQGTYNMSIGKGFMFSSGAQWVEQPGVISNGAGLIGSIGTMFGKWGKLSIQLNCRNNIDNLFDFHTGQILVSTNAAIVW
ncbi:MAG TPA: hypothetical protein VK783_02200 [Bacteroidia bacterium]|nr:hypothetical protein [Bacteroidia bacterium]